MYYRKLPEYRGIQQRGQDLGYWEHQWWRVPAGVREAPWVRQRMVTNVKISKLGKQLENNLIPKMPIIIFLKIPFQRRVPINFSKNKSLNFKKIENSNVTLNFHFSLWNLITLWLLLIIKAISENVFNVTRKLVKNYQNSKIPRTL